MKDLSELPGDMLIRERVISPGNDISDRIIKPINKGRVTYWQKDSPHKTVMSVRFTPCPHAFEQKRKILPNN